MDFMKVIKSLELLLYELMVWLVFYPMTLWRAFVRPLALMQYAHAELENPEEDRFSDTLSPPIFLAISLGMIRLMEIAGEMAEQEGVLADDNNLIAFRIVSYAMFPLMLSLRMLRLQGIALDRRSLRSPFYAQCFVVAPFAFLIGIAGLVWTGADSAEAGLVLIATAFAWYFAVQTVWFRRELGMGWLRSFVNVLRSVLAALLLSFAISVAISPL